jgi:hypothetical protein
MSQLSWKAGLAGLAIAAATAYELAQMPPGHPGPASPGDQARPTMPSRMPAEMHDRMMQMMQGHVMQGPGGMHGGAADGGMIGQQSGMQAQPTMPGQDAFGAIAEVVRILENDPTTDWSRVSIAALREHLIDMNEVTLQAVATERTLDDGIEIAITGEGRTLRAIKRMVPAHAAELTAVGWKARTEDLSDGVRLVVTASDPKQVSKLQALGFMGIMVQGDHHQPHHLMIAKGELPAH